MTTCPSCVCAETSAREPSETAKVLATSVWSAYYIDAPAFETNRELFKHAFECGHARASEDMGAEVAKLKGLLHDFETCDLSSNVMKAHELMEIHKLHVIEIKALREQLAAAQAERNGAEDAAVSSAMLLAMANQKLAAAELRAAEYEKALEYALEGLAMFKKYSSPGNIADIEQRIRTALSKHRRGGE